jgi:DNA recombination protein Rad52
VAWRRATYKGNLFSAVELVSTLYPLFTNTGTVERQRVFGQFTVGMNARNGNTCSTATLAAERDQTEVIGEQLSRFLGPEYISYRKGEGGRMLAYAEGHEVIGMMNTIFGWHGWTSKAVHFDTDYATCDNGGKWSVGVAATVRLTVQVKDGGKVREVFHEDVGYGTMDNGPGRGKAMEKCRKEAVTDGLKRAARQFGSATGGCLYNKDYLERIKKVRGPADRIEFDEEELVRKPINKRRRFLLAQEKAQVVFQAGTAREEYGDSDDEMFAEIPESEELIST